MWTWIPFLPVLPPLPAGTWDALQVSLLPIPLTEQQRLPGSSITPGCHSRDVDPSLEFGDILITLCQSRWCKQLRERGCTGDFGEVFVFWQRRNCALSVGSYPQPMKKSKPQICFVTQLSFYDICPNFSHCAVTIPENSSFIFFLIFFFSFLK